MAKLTYYSHAAWKIETGQHTILIDPFITGNPTAPVQAADIKADFIIVTHAHGDHLGDAVPIAQKNNALIISNFEIASWCQNQGVNAHPLHIGGSREFPFGRVKLTQAFHGSSFPDGSYGGMPAGVLITIEGKTLYHSGDTGLFGDMVLIGKMTPIDIALIPIGDNFTMGIEDAIQAVAFLQPKKVIPMHYSTFDIINTDPEQFIDQIKKKGFKGEVVPYGASIDF
jgi:L-ascorbate metabolism protein UlaG (beta-lactamase superfamily)